MKKIIVILLAVCVSAGMGRAKEVEEKYDDGSLKKKYHVDEQGKKSGKYVEYHENGKRKIQAKYKDGNLHGPYQSYFPTGKTHIRTSYVGGKIHGPYMEYSDKGKPVREELYADGVLCYPRSLREINSVISRLEREKKKTGGAVHTTRPDRGQAQAGRLPGSLLNQALAHLKIYRYLAGVPYEDVTLNETYNSESQHGAVLLSILGRLSHNPKRPAGVSDEFFKTAKKGCASSNLHQGRGNLVAAINDWINDSDKRNIKRLGHRRWCLNPTMQQTGFGLSASFCALWAIDRKRKEVPDYDYVCFPVRGYHPVAYFKPDWAWHVSLNPKKYKKPDKNVKAKIFPVDPRFSKGTSPLKHNYDNISLSRNGIPNAIIFRPENLKMGPGTRYMVEITGIKDSSGKDVTIRYFVEFTR